MLFHGFLEKGSLIWSYRKYLRFLRKIKKLMIFFFQYNVFELFKTYVFYILNKKHCQNLKKTLDLDYYRILSYIYFFDPPLYVKNTKKKSLYFLYWFKRSFKWLFWFIISAFYPLIYFKYIIWLFVYKHFIKYFFRFLDILIRDILEDLIDITLFYKPIKKIIKYIFLDFFFHVIPLCYLNSWINFFLGALGYTVLLTSFFGSSILFI